MNESEVKTKIAKCMRDSGGYGRRYEDQYAVGLPDLILIPRGGPVFFAEAKIIRLVNGGYGPTARQFIELCRIRDTKAAVPLLIGCDPFNGEICLNKLAEWVNAKEALASGHPRDIEKLLRTFVGVL